MENLALQMKLAVLWIISAVCTSAAVVVSFMMPGVIEEIIAGEIEGMPISEGLLLVVALSWLIGLTMAFLSLTLKASANRWANIIMGIVTVAMGIFDSSNILIQGKLALLLIDVYLTVVAALIVWYAWKWPRQEVVTKQRE